MDFWQAVSSGFRKYTDFNGRAVRSEFWHFLLFVFLIGACAWNVDSAILGRDWGEMPDMHMREIMPLSACWYILAAIPSFAVGARRLHDIDRSGWWLLLLGVPVLGALWLVYWAVLKGGDQQSV